MPETKGLSLEQVDRMLEETTPRTSAKWVPHSTFAGEMGLTGEKKLEREPSIKANTSDEPAAAPTEVNREVV